MGGGSQGSAGSAITRTARGLAGSGGGSAAAQAGSGGDGQRAATRRRAAKRRGRARSQAFRRDVRRLQPCFYALSEFAEDVLSMRAGLGGKSPRSAGFVAKKLGVSRARVRRTQRGGLRTLKRTNRSDHCALSPAGAPGGTWVQTMRALLSVSPLQAMAAIADTRGVGAAAPKRDRDSGGVLGARAASGPSGDNPAEQLAPPAVSTAAAPDESDGALLLWLLTLLTLTLLLLVGLTRGRKTRRPAAAAAGAAAAGKRRGPATPKPVAKPKQQPESKAPPEAKAPPEPKPPAEVQPPPEPQPNNEAKPDGGPVLPAPPWAGEQSPERPKGHRRGHGHRPRSRSRRSS